jgi:adenosylhomocysteine nucleosidase
MLKQPLICIVSATLMEADPLIKILDLKQIEKKPFNIHANEERGILLGISGIGKAYAAMGTAFCCTKYRPDIVLNTGAAGAVDESRKVGAVFQIKKTIEPDRPHLRSNTPMIQTPTTLDGFNSAVLATQDKPIIDTETFKELSSIADLVDMEGASVLQTAKKFNTECLLFKFVSDTPLHAGKGMIVDNIKEHVGSFGEFVSSSVIPAIISS